ncbi:hypothetical protein HYC85_011255 [Camellia sinensis]|uniref:Transmembrane protein n=1 Tax=Camellia sinensis TaxID=4442 RepID=A0A7J7H8J8_CAMSI|nr:hypothetical protein HYC85_011255 [Camellia sinensis]
MHADAVSKLTTFPHLGMNSNGQSPFSVDGSPVRQTQPPAPPQQPSVDTNTDARTGNIQNQHPSTSHDCQTRTRTRTQTQTQTRVKTRSWFEILTEKTSGGDNLLKLSKTLLATNFSAAVAVWIFRSEGSPLQSALNSNPPHGKSFGILVACILFGFICNMSVILLQKESPIAASIGAYAGALSSVIGFLTMIQMILPHTLLWIVWPAGVFIFLSFLYVLTRNRVATEDVNVMFYWGGKTVSDHESVSYSHHVKKFCKVEKGTTLCELEAMIVPEVALNGENMQLEFNYRIPYWQSKYEVKYDLLPIDNDKTLAFVLNQPKSSSSEFILQFYVDCKDSTMGNITSCEDFAAMRTCRCIAQETPRVGRMVKVWDLGVYYFHNFRFEIS